MKNNKLSSNFSKKREEENFYIAIQNPEDLRRELLGSVKMTIKLLQKCEHINEQREKKLKLMQEFHDSFTAINMLIKKLKQTVPKARAKSAPSKILNSSKEGVIKENKHEISRLQRDLDDIENKLEGLS